jgi:hypothetical protein
MNTFTSDQTIHADNYSRAWRAANNILGSWYAPIQILVIPGHCKRHYEGEEGVEKFGEQHKRARSDMEKDQRTVKDKLSKDPNEVAEAHLPATEPLKCERVDLVIKSSNFFVRDDFYIPYHELKDETLVEAVEYILNNPANRASKNRVYADTPVKWSAVITFSDALSRWLRQVYLILLVDISEDMVYEGHSFKSWKKPRDFIKSFRPQHVAASLICAVYGPTKVTSQKTGLFGFRTDPRFKTIIEPCIDFVVENFRPATGKYDKNHIINRCNPVTWRDQARARIRRGFWTVPAIDEALNNHLIFDGQEYEMKELEQMVDRMIYEFALVFCCVDGPEGSKDRGECGYDLMGWTNPSRFFTHQAQKKEMEFEVVIQGMKLWGIGEPPKPELISIPGGIIPGGTGGEKDSGDEILPDKKDSGDNILSEDESL